MIRFKRFRYSLGILIISVALCGFWQRANAQVVEIPDPNLERAIREDLGLSSEIPITQQEMLRLRDIEAGQRQITDLTGLEFASNLYGLYVGGSFSSSLDLSPLLNLTELKVVFIRRSRISDMTVLGNLTQLTRLVLDENGIRDITALAGLVNLDGLVLLENPIADLSPLANLTQLKELSIRATSTLSDKF